MPGIFSSEGCDSPELNSAFDIIDRAGGFGNVTLKIRDYRLGAMIIQPTKPKGEIRPQAIVNLRSTST